MDMHLLIFSIHVLPLIKSIILSGSKTITYYLDEDYDRSNVKQALDKALDIEKYALGVLYQKEGDASFENQLHVYEEDKTPIIKRTRNIKDVQALLKAF